MRILHFTLGLPPYRSGGLTKYAIDLMINQSAKNEVSMLYSGGSDFFHKKSYITKCQSYKNISVYKLMNSVPVPLLYGIKEPLYFTGVNCKLDNLYLDYLYETVKPDILHIHTLMGLPLELVLYLKKKGVKIVYTTHDYYGLCLKVNFINSNNCFCQTNSGVNCAICNYFAPNIFFLKLRNLEIIYKIKKYVPKKYLNKSKQNKIINVRIKNTNDYNKLLEYYNKIFSKIDYYLFNSSVSESVYKSFLKIDNSVVLPITHNNILDNRKTLILSENIILGFIGSAETYKGLPVLINALKNLYKSGICNWELHIYGNFKGVDSECNKIKYKGTFKNNDIKQIYSNINLLVVPSIWKETFSLVTLEALSYGTPCLVSNNVGAKDLIKQIDSRFIFEIGNIEEKLLSILNNISILIEYNKKILNFNLLTSEKHTRDIISLYKKLLFKS